MLVPVMLSMLMAPPLQGQPLLDDLSRRAVKYFWEQSNPTTGLTKDRAANFKKSDKYFVASVAATGYALAAYSIGAHRGWLHRAEALDRCRSTVLWLNEHGLKEHGWFYHFIDWRNGSRVWNSEASSIDTGLFLAGEIIAEDEFNDPRLTQMVQDTFNQVDWNWMPNATTICMGWHPEDGFIKARWDGQYEEMFLNLIALGSSKAIPDSLWPSVRRTPLVNYQDTSFIIGGCIFMHQMSQGFLNFEGKRDELGYDYWIEGRNACLGQKRYAIANPDHFKEYGADFWGLNAGDGPSGYEGNGVPDGPDDGTISPTGAIASILYDRDMATSVANHLATAHPETLGRYGFSNGINPTHNWFGPDVIGIDLGMELMAIESARDGLPQKLSMESPIYQEGLRRAGFHATEEGPIASRPLILAPQ